MSAAASLRGKPFVHRVCTVWSWGFFFPSCIKFRQSTCSNCLLPFSFTLQPKADCISNQSLTMHGSRSGASSAVEFISTRNHGHHLRELSASPDSWPCLPLLLACMWTCSRTRKHAERHVARLFWSHIWCINRDPGTLKERDIHKCWRWKQIKENMFK